MKLNIFAALVVLAGFSCGQGVDMNVDGVEIDEAAIVEDGLSIVMMVPGLAAKVTLDKNVYVNKPNSIRCIKAPCPSNAEVATGKFEFVVKNVSRKTVVLANTAANCLLSVEVRSIAGAELVRTDDPTRRCTRNLVDLVIKPGQTLRYSDEFPMEVQSNQEQLAGDYALTVGIKNSTGLIEAVKLFGVDPR